MVLTAKLIRYAMMGSRSLYTTPIRSGDARSLQKLKILQAHYQAEDGRPIWLKAGLRDRILYTTTIVACVFGVTNVLMTIYHLAKPASWANPPEC